MNHDVTVTKTEEAFAAQALEQIEQLVRFARKQHLIASSDTAFVRNALLDLFHFAEPYEGYVTDQVPEHPQDALEVLLSYGALIGLIPDNTTTWRDLLDARIMGLLMPRPSETAERFRKMSEQEGVIRATDDFYSLNVNSNYIRMDRIAKNQQWAYHSDFGDLEITINLSKPEKDPKEIALLKTMPQAHYPKCLLCRENVGYAGRANHPARQNLRVIPLSLQGEAWFFQYSPYVYYNEHSIVLSGEHTPMKISGKTFARLLDFIDQFPHYFIGSNADLPIVGGSILNHDHFQAGRHTFAMQKAAIEQTFRHPQLPGVKFGTVKWPMSVVRLQGADKQEMLKAAELIMTAWNGYSDQQAEVAAWTEHESGERTPHNTVTPIARLVADGYEMDLVLRNNRTSEEHPDGIFHPHQHLHHIKKENIGLIEVMGLAVLPGRLQSELEQIGAYLTGEVLVDESLQDAAHPLRQHAAWIGTLLEKYGTSLSAGEARQALQAEVGGKFMEVLQDAGIYKRTAKGQEAFQRFMLASGLIEA
ncbi:UDP-glucose--hexose-1-phosphate uridylyltransferase [Paenibacillus sp. GCM10012307]|uniref:Galactose-1-phosphate uridylyltransferase n=1 Tax=Paenibacillus roseus TaxID=2798579 RepID=A0A934J205_9BACL|nr:UDP-glucose--hexose-1-phosphate uridylyltransferase [Paenibacillus roseus]MBJ6361335.1 UDP-glucose--hexose-1-phosphate uridylyltransferase [Paenibacillus roseus]